MKPPTVLLIEDNHVTRKLFRVALQGAGYTVLEAPDAQSALSLTRTYKPDLILQDLVLPDMDGFALIHQLRALPHGADIPILASSGFLSRPDEKQLFTAGFTDLLIKPVEPVTLLTTIQAYLSPPQENFQQKPGAGKRVLLVDDDAAQRQLARLLLQHLGYEITIASDGAEALLLARENVPDVVISDVLMPGLDGFALCSALRREPSLAGVPVILVTSQYIDEADRHLGLKVGANAFVDRTPGLEEVIKALDQILKTPEPSAAPREYPEKEHTHRLARQLERQIHLNARLTQRCALQSAALMLLSTISEALTRRQDIQSAMDEVLAFCMDAGGISRGILYLKQRSGDFLTRFYGVDQDHHNQIRDFFRHPAPLNRFLQEGAPVMLSSASSPSEEVQDLLTRAGVKSALLVPILSRGEPLGALLFASEDVNLNQPEWLLFSRTVAGQLGQAIALTEAFQQVTSGEEKFRTLIASINDVVITMDREQRCTGIYGQSHDESFPLKDCLGKTPREIFGEEAARVHENANRRALQGENVVYEWSFEAEGMTIYLQNSLAPMRSASGEISGLVCICRNITEQKNTKTQLLVTERMASIGMLAAGVAHEINNPLAAVIANLDFMAKAISQIEQETGDLDTLPPGASLPFSSGLLLDPIKDALQDAREGAERVRQIVRDLKLLSRPDKEQRGPVDVRRVIESSLRIAWNEIRHRARLIKEYGQVDPVEANEARLGQVFLNLIVNAAQAIPAGQAEKNVIRIETYTNAEQKVVVKISDTGPGISSRLLGRIFDPFFTTKPIGTGTGLGLAICQRIVNSLGGKILVESEENKGTTFSVVLPAALPNEKASPPSETIPDIRRSRLLVIDDEPLIGTVLKRTLQDIHDVTHLMDGQEALQRLLSGERFDLILCDLMMPALTGMELYEELSKKAPEQAERIVFITGGTFTPQAGNFLKKFSDRILEKPFDSKDLGTLLGRWLE